MASVSATIEYTSSRPREQTVVSNGNTDVNSDDAFNQLTLTIPNDYQLVKLTSLLIQSINVATLPAITAGEEALLQIVRSGEGIYSGAKSLNHMLIGASTPSGQLWPWAPSELQWLPNLQPQDQLDIFLGPVDDNGTPTADLGWQITFLVITR